MQWSLIYERIKALDTHEKNLLEQRDRLVEQLCANQRELERVQNERDALEGTPTTEARND